MKVCSLMNNYSSAWNLCTRRAHATSPRMTLIISHTSLKFSRESKLKGTRYQFPIKFTQGGYIKITCVETCCIYRAMWFLFGKVLYKFPSKDWMDFHKGIMWKNNEEIPFQFFKANNGAWNIHQWLFFFAAISQLNAIIIIALWLHYAKRVHAAINDANASTPVKIVTIAEPKQTNLIYSPHSGCKSQISRWWFWQITLGSFDAVFI